MAQKSSVVEFVQCDDAYRLNANEMFIRTVSVCFLTANSSCNPRADKPLTPIDARLRQGQLLEERFIRLTNEQKSRGAKLYDVSHRFSLSRLLTQGTRHHTYIISRRLLWRHPIPPTRAAANGDQSRPRCGVEHATAAGRDWA